MGMTPNLLKIGLLTDSLRTHNEFIFFKFRFMNKFRKYQKIPGDIYIKKKVYWICTVSSMFGVYCIKSFTIRMMPLEYGKLF